MVHDMLLFRCYCWHVYMQSTSAVQSSGRPAAYCTELSDRPDSCQPAWLGFRSQALQTGH